MPYSIGMNTGTQTAISRIASRHTRRIGSGVSSARRAPASCGSALRALSIPVQEEDSGSDQSKSSDPLGQDIYFVVALIILSALVAVLWFADPAHQPRGESRMGWPSVESTKR